MDHEGDNDLENGFEEPQNSFGETEENTKACEMSSQSEDAASKPSEEKICDVEPDGNRIRNFSQRGETPTRRKGFFVFLACIVVFLCVTLSFVASFAGSALAKKLFGEESAEDSSAGDSPVQGFLPFPDLKREETTEKNFFLEEPEAVLDKSDPEKSVYGSAGADVFSVSEVTRRVQNAVVVIDATVVTGNFFGQSSESVSSGSGVIVSKDGYVLTCHHVVEGAKSLKVSLDDGGVFAAKLVGSDAASDLAILKIDSENEFDYVAQGCSADLVPGEQVVAIGNPLGTLGGTVTTGIISATEREVTMQDGTKMNLIQTDAAINSGNSGGGLFNLDGELIGIVNAKYSASGVEGLAFAIPVDFAYEVQLDLMKYGYVRGVVDVGLSFLDVTAAELPRYYARYGLIEAGIYISDYPEYAKELMPSDRVVSVNGMTFANKALLEEMLASCKVGETVTFVVSRAGEKDKNGVVQWKELTVEVTLREYVPEHLRTDEEKD